jgi:putative transposase
MHRLLHPLFGFLASLTRQELARQVAYLKAENRILRARLPERLVATPSEKRRLIRLGKKLGTQLRELISIATYQTFQRWVRDAEEARTAKKHVPKRKPGRPRTPDDIRELVLKLARENTWGYTRILGELRKLGIRSISRQTVKVILKENDIDPGPQRGKGSWDEFLKIHADTLWQCDFVSKPMWTTRGLVDLYFLVGLHLETRRGGICPKNFEHPVEVSVDIRPRDSAWLGLGGCRGGPSEGLRGRNRSDQIIEPSIGSPLAGLESVCAAFRDKVPLFPSATANSSNDAIATT